MSEDVDEGVYDRVCRQYEAEIERLRLQVGLLEAERMQTRQTLKDLHGTLWTDEEVEHEIELCRAAVIEECAKVAENPNWTAFGVAPQKIAAAIRALKT